MAVTLLKKGQRVDLTKGQAGLSKIMVGLGWDPVQASAPKKSGGLLKSMFGGGTQAAPNIDCDASVLMLDANEKLRNNGNAIYFGNLKSRDGAVQHLGDNLTGAGEGDDEQIIINLSQVSPDVQKLVFIVNIYDCERRKQDFGLIQNAFIRVVNLANNQELLRFNLTEQFAGLTTLFVGEIYRHQNEWKFAALGQGTQDSSLRQIIARYM